MMVLPSCEGEKWRFREQRPDDQSVDEHGERSNEPPARLPLPYEQAPSSAYPSSSRGPVQTRFPSHAPSSHGAGCRPRTRAGTSARASRPAQDRALLVSLYDHGKRSLVQPGDTRDRLH